MDEQTLRRAKELASRAYQVHVFPDASTDGELGFVATVPELPICMADGDSVEEAKHNLESAIVDFIYFLLEDGLPVPEPRLIGSHTIIDMSDYLDLENESYQFSSVKIEGNYFA